MSRGPGAAKTFSPLLRILLFVGVSQIAMAGVGQAQMQANGLPAPGMLPDHPLYVLKSASERVGTLFTFGDVEDGERSLDLAEKRLSEASALVAKGKSAMAERTLVRYQDQLDRALAKAEEARAKGVDTDELSARASVAALRHQAVLADVYERVPEEARPGIERAMQAGMRGHEKGMRGISGEKRGEVMRDVERHREESHRVLEELRGRGIPVPAVRTSEEVERGRPDRPGRGEPAAPGGR